jgi:hypothetical protein
MSAAVRIESDAFGDARFDVLGNAAGYNRFEALGRMAHLYRYCTDRCLYIVSEAAIVACLGPKGVEAIIAADLGERQAGGIRVKGTQGRIEWLTDLRKSASEGGKARARSAKRDGGKFTSRLAGDSPASDQPGSSHVAGEIGEIPAIHQPSAGDSPASDQPKSSALIPSPSPSPSKEIPPPPPSGGRRHESEPEATGGGSVTHGVNTASSPKELADLWTFNAKGPGHRLGVRELIDGFAAMVQAGHSVEALRVEILRKDRDRSETWQTFRVRLSKAREAKGVQHAQAVEAEAAHQARIKRSREEMAERDRQIDAAPRVSIKELLRRQREAAQTAGGDVNGKATSDDSRTDQPGGENAATP